MVNSWVLWCFMRKIEQHRWTWEWVSKSEKHGKRVDFIMENKGNGGNPRSGKRDKMGLIGIYQQQAFVSTCDLTTKKQVGKWNQHELMLLNDRYDNPINFTSRYWRMGYDRAVNQHHSVIDVQKNCVNHCSIFFLLSGSRQKILIHPNISKPFGGGSTTNRFTIAAVSRCLGQHVSSHRW